MKLTKKKVFIAALALCLVAILSMGTLAWFSASDEVNNEFIIADSEDDANEIFSINVWEAVPGNPMDTDGYTYNDILPGATLTKKPCVQNTGYYDQYVRVIVTFSDAQAWAAALGTDFDMTTLLGNYNANQWTNVSDNWDDFDSNTQELTYVFYYNGVLAKNQFITVFDGFTVPSSLTVDQAAEFEGNFTVKVKAQAVQTENLGANNAYDAFTVVGLGLAD